MKRLIILIILLIILGVGFGVFYYEGSLPVNSKDTETQTFVVKKGATVNEIINDLSDQDLIRNKITFLFIVKQLNIESEIQAGSFRLSPSLSAKEIALTLTKGTNDIWVTVIEGLRKEEIAQVLAKELDIPETEFIKQAEEGVLFPDTYLVARDASVGEVLNMFERNFNKKYDETLRQKAKAKGLTDNEVLTLASLVEREANSPESKREVASILYKRLQNDWPLQVDATLQYAIGYIESEKSWWKGVPTGEDKQVQSLYNTYINEGLPPGPIASPGLDSIIGVIEADPNTPYWFYISNKDGSKMIYSETLEEHNRNIDKFLR